MKLKITDDIEKTFKCPMTILMSCLRSFRINGAERVKHLPSTNQDYSLPEDLRLAKYNENLLSENWNKSVPRQCIWKRIMDTFKYGLLKRTFPILFLFILGYYIFHVLIMNGICTDYFEAKTRSLEEEPFKTKDTISRLKWFRLASKVSPKIPSKSNKMITHYCQEYTEMLHTWRKEDRDFTKILTFLIGFYLSFTVRCWLKQMESLPKIDEVCMVLDSISDKNAGKQDKEKEKEYDEGSNSVSAKQIKKRIARLCMLSWTMCLSRISTRLKSQFDIPSDYNSKGLMTKNEYQLLNGVDGSDCWIEKWSLPLLWVKRIIYGIGKDPKYANVEIKDPKELGIALSKFQCELQKMCNPYYHRIPCLVIEVLTCALYFSVLLGIFAGHGPTYHNKENTIAYWAQIIYNFPLFQCIKYILLFGWLKTAKDLQNPFGTDRDDVDLHVFLDRNIWQASIMLIDNVALNHENVAITNWNDLDDWGAQEKNVNHFENNKTTNQSNNALTLSTCETTNSSGLQIPDTENLKSQIISIPNHIYENNESQDTLYCSDINEKFEVGSLEEMKESYVPVSVGSTSGSNDIMV